MSSDEHTNATVPLESVRRRLVPKSRGDNPRKYLAWLTGHCVCAGCGIVALTLQLLMVPNIWYIISVMYRLSLLGALVALTATFSHKFGLHYLPSLALLLSQSNFQYMVLAVAWIFTFRSIFKLAPYVIISALQLGSRFERPEIKTVSPIAARAIVGCEWLLMLTLLVRTLLLSGTSGFELSLLLFFHWLRVLFDPATRARFERNVARINEKFGTKNEKLANFLNAVQDHLKEDAIMPLDYSDSKKEKT